MFGLPVLIQDFGGLAQILPEEYLKYLQPLPNLLLGFLAALILTPIIGKLAMKYGVTYKPGVKRLGREYDNPEKAVHDVETPGLGGLAITLPLFLFVVFAFGWTSVSAPFIIALAIMIVGAALDDIYNLPAIVQLLTHIVAALVVAASVVDFNVINIPLIGAVNFDWAHVSFDFLGIPWNLVFPGDILLVGWIMVCINAVKWVGGSPGLVESNSFVAFVMLYILGLRTLSDFVTLNSIFIAGALLGFLIFAFPPQKIMSGTSGKALYGFIIAVFAIINGAKFASTLMIIMLPFIDFVYVLVKRMVKTKQLNPMKLMRINGPEHLHHQLLALGLSGKQVLLAESSVTLLVGSVAILTTGAIKLFLLVLCAFLIFAGIFAVNIYRQRIERRRSDDGDSPEGKYAY